MILDKQLYISRGMVFVLVIIIILLKIMFIQQKPFGHQTTNRMRANIFWARVTATITKETCHRLTRAGLKLATQHIPCFGLGTGFVFWQCNHNRRPHLLSHFARNRLLNAGDLYTGDLNPFKMICPQYKTEVLKVLPPFNNQKHKTPACQGWPAEREESVNENR